MSEVRKMKTGDKTIIYYLDGKMHNWEGPALIPQGNKRLAEYYLFGIKYNKDDWETAKKEENGVPFHKTAASKKMGNRS